MNLKQSWIANDSLTIKLLPPPPINIVKHFVETNFKPSDGLVDLLELGGGEYRVIVYSKMLDVTD